MNHYNAPTECLCCPLDRAEISEVQLQENRLFASISLQVSDRILGPLLGPRSHVDPRVLC